MQVIFTKKLSLEGSKIKETKTFNEKKKKCQRDFRDMGHLDKAIFFKCTASVMVFYNNKKEKVLL